MFRALYDFPKVTIAAVNGPAIAGGCGLATLCDFTLASGQKSSFYINSKGGGTPYRLKIRAPSFVNLSILGELLPGCMISDVPVVLGSIDFVLGESDR